MPARLRCSISILLHVFFVGVAASGAQTAAVRGTVSDPSQMPISGALVRLLEGGVEQGRAETERDGSFVIAIGAASCSACSLEVTKAGFDTTSVGAGVARSIDITLPVGAIRESVVVTATGRETTESTVGSSITVLPRDHIEARRALSTIDLLRSVPGAIASRPGGVGNLTSLWVRGGESNFNKVLLDGVPLNEPGGAFNFAAISPDNIERIEVLRGAHSALFGSDAMASVIQLFSARPEAGRPRVDLTLDGGTYATVHTAAGLSAQRDTLDFRAFGSLLETDNREPNNAHTMKTVSGSLGSRAASGAAVRIMGRADMGRTGVPGATAFGPPDQDARFLQDTSTLSGGWDQPLGTRSLQRASYSFARSRQESVNLSEDPPYTPEFGDRRAPFEFFDFLYHSTSDLRRHHLDYRNDITIGRGHTLTAALAYDAERGVLTDHLSTDEPQRPERDNVGATVQYEYLAGPISAAGGVRFEHNGSFGFFAAPRASVSWLVSTTRLHAAAGLGIKEPTFLQSYSPNTYFLGNPDLDAERSRGFDAGIEQRLVGNRVGIDVTYFANRFNDLISLQTIDPAAFSSQYFNIGETRADGVEVAVDAVIRGGLQVSGHYTFLSSEVVRSTSTSPIFVAGRELFRRPRHSGSLQGTFVRQRLSAMLGGVFVGGRVDTDAAALDMTWNEGYVLVNAAGDVRLARRTSAFVAAENLADCQYMDPLGFRGLGRTLRAGIRARF